MRTEALRQLLVLGIGCGLLGGCESDLAERIALAGLNQQCRINSDCSELLVCVFERCHEQCASSRDCDAGVRCVTTDQRRNVCQLPEEASCSGGQRCPGGELCGPDAQCRDACQSDGDCVTDQVCSAGACAESTELDERGRLPESPERGAQPTPCTFDSECPGQQVCVAGTCRVECTRDGDCPPREQCQSGACEPVEVVPSGACLRSSDCEQGLACVSGACVAVTPPPEPECSYDSDCSAAGQHCRDGACRCECAADADCETGYGCSGACQCVPSRVVYGDVIVNNDRELRALANVVEITGQLTLDIVQNGDFHVPNLRKARRILASNSGATAIFDALEEVSEAFNCSQDCRTEKLRVAGDVQYNSQELRELSLPALESAGNFNVSFSPKLKAVRLPQLASAKAVMINGNDQLTTLEAPLLATLDSLQLLNNKGLRSLSLPLARPVISVQFSGNQALETVSLPSVTLLSASLAALDLPELRSLSLPNLLSSEFLELRRLPKLQSLELTILRELASGAHIDNLGSPIAVALPALESAGPLLISDSKITSLSAPKAALLGALQLTGLPQLSSLDLGKLVVVGPLLILGTGLSELRSLTIGQAGALASAVNVTIGNNTQLPGCAVTALEQALLAQGFTGTLYAYDNLVCPCNGAVCQ